MDQFVQGNQWLEPLMPAILPDSMLAKASRIPFLAGELRGLLPPQTALRLGALMRITSSYYSNLIEGQYTEPASLAPLSPQRTGEDLQQLALAHIRAQRVFERAGTWSIHRGQPWSAMFSSDFVASVHRRLFKHATREQLSLGDGSQLQPGELRSETQKNVIVGRDHFAPSWESVDAMILRMQQVYGRCGDPRYQLLGSLAYHHRLAYVHPFEDGNGRVVRMITHLQLHRLGLASPLWSLSRGLARKQDEYYARLRNADQARRGDLDGRGQLSQAGLLEFMNFMLDTCIDQMTYIREALSVGRLRERLDKLVALHERFTGAGIKTECARALHVLITQGKVLRADFKVFTGLHDRVASEQLRKLIEMGVVEAPSAKSRYVYPGLPVWFAQLVFPDLHTRLAS